VRRANYETNAVGNSRIMFIQTKLFKQQIISIIIIIIDIIFTIAIIIIIIIITSTGLNICGPLGNKYFRPNKIIFYIHL
jgi:hypothetical protein